VAVLTMNRPEALNALNDALTEQLAAALENADADPNVRAVVITGSDRAFCAGADVTGLHGISTAEAVAPDGFARRLFDVLTPYRKPVIAAVRGLALGGGCEIALACDLVVAGESARFGLPEVTLGVMPGAGGTQRIVHALGKAKAMRLLLTGDAISAADAQTAGLVAEVVPDEECLDTAAAIAQGIARNAPLAVQLAKDAARSAYDFSLTQGLAFERRNFFLLTATEDMREGVQAFLDKRNRSSPETR
jgi:enoyl-CoA hydratase